MIRLYPDPCLRVCAQPVSPSSPEASQAARSLRETFAQVEGLGLAATQLGLPYRVTLVQLGDEQYVLINPKLTGRSKERVVDSEGCLSLPGLEAGIARAQAVQIHALQEDGSPVELHAEDLQARVILHELDHLDGVLFVDHLPAGLRKQLLTGYKTTPKEATSHA